MNDNYEKILRDAKADYDRTNMYSDFLQLKLGQKKAIDESLDN